jgi:phosphate/sulfate permease
VDDTLLFLHVLSAFLLMSAVVMLSAVALGAPAGTRVVSVGNLLWDVGGLGTLAFGVWIVLREDVYDITDGWILAAIVLWFLATGAGVRARQAVTEGEEPRYTPLGARLHWMRAVIVVGFLVLMVWKPGA